MDFSQKETHQSFKVTPNMDQFRTKEKRKEKVWLASAFFVRCCAARQN